MKLLKFKNMAMIGAMSIAGVGLIGVGAHATFTQNTTSSQTVAAGNLSVVLSASGASGNGTTTIGLPNVTNVGSSFMSTPDLITITNNGSLTANEINLQVTNSGSSALNSEMYLCLYSDHAIVFNGLVSADEALGNMAVGGSVAPAGTDSYTAVFYAGNEPTGCGNVAGYQYGTVDDVGSAPLTTYPVPAAAPDAGSPVGNSNLATTLQPDSESGTDTVSVTVTYSA